MKEIAEQLHTRHRKSTPLPWNSESNITLLFHEAFLKQLMIAMQFSAYEQLVNDWLTQVKVCLTCIPLRLISGL